MKLAEGVSQKISNICVVCIFLIVCIHVWVPMPEANMAKWTYNLFGGILGGIGVPFFFAVSGFFLTRHVDESGWWRRALSSRFRSLLIPFLIWCTLWIFVESSGVILKNANLSRPLLKGLDLSPCFFFTAFGFNLLTDPAVPAFWYIRALLIFVVISPLLVRMSNRFALVILFACYLVIKSTFRFESDWGHFWYYGLSVEGLFYFMLGIYFSRKNIVPSERWGKCAAVTSLVLLSMEMSGLRFGYFTRGCFIFAALWTLWVWMPEKLFPRWMTDNVFSVFAMHQMLQGVLKEIPLGAFSYRNVATSSFLYFFYVAVSFFVPVAVACFIKRYLPRFASVIFGGR